MSTWLAGKNNPDAGFTLLELLVVLAIMGLAYGLAVPIYSRLLPSVTISSTAEEVMSDLRRSRLEAILRGKAVAFVLQENGEGYSISELEKETLTKDIIFSFQEQDRQKITFTPDGKNGGFVLFVKSGGREKKITSDWITGRITMDRER